MLKFIGLPFFSKHLCKRNVFKTHQIRYFLSESFRLEKVWGERIQSPILKKINIYDLFHELDNQFQHFGQASALDIDLFVNAVNDDSCFDEIEDVLHKLRLTPEAVNILPSTHHAFIRLYLQWNKTDDLMRVLDDRLNYGIFPDDYCSLLMFDTFIKGGNFRDAAKVATLSMLQEDVSNPLIKYMALYSCHKYLENPVPWNPKSDEIADDQDDEDEVVKVRVNFIRNPYFDDHFDLVDPKHLIGKTFSFIGAEINDHVGRTHQLLGLLLHDKLELAKNFLTDISNSKENHTLLTDGLNMASKILEENSTGDAKENNAQPLINELKELLNNVPDSRAVEGNLLVIVEDKLQDLTKKNEVLEINKQLEMYENWEKNREKLLNEQIAKIKREKTLAEILRQKALLKQKEEELFFFDNQDKLDLVIEEKDKRREARLERERKKREAAINFRVVPAKKVTRIVKSREAPPLETFFDDNIPMKLIKTKL